MKIVLKATISIMAIFMSVCNNICAQNMPAGYFDENTLSCFTKFESTGFGASVLFETNQTNTSMGDADDYRQIGVFDIPLVGDLNGDGKPEIVVLSRSRRGTLGDWENDVCNRFLLIFDGQTGKLLVKKRLAIDSYTYGESYHGTPCTLLLMNVDNNNTRQIVVAYGTAGSTVNGKWAKRLVCYELNPQSGKGLPNVPSGKSDAGSTTSELNSDYLKIKWVSDKRYDWSATSQTGTSSTSWSFTAGEAGRAFTDTGGYYYSNYQYFSTPLPQLVDFDGDGTPEIYVYNKIYDAKTGKLKLVLESLGPANSTGNNDNYITPLYANIENRAFVGRDRTATRNKTGPGDTNVPFAFIYDLDKDGKYDIAAGGKVYYNITFPSDGAGGWNFDQPAASGYYSVMKGVKNDSNGSNVGWPYGSNTYLGDGHTAVADINADGIPEVVVLTRTPGNVDATSPLILTVYNPGFFQLDASRNIIPGTGVPSIIAQRTITPTGGADEGNHSYLFIGDLDGLEQNGKQFPEITFITRRLYGGTDTNYRIHHTNPANSKLHPNIRSNAAFISKLNKQGDNYWINYDSSANGVMMSFTWDDDDTRINERMKVSFVAELNDRSINTGFTLFDFDNDGRQGICYRDESYLRIISVDAPYYVKNTDTPSTSGSLVRFRESVQSYTGFEYPVIADINGDFSADMVVTAASSVTANTGWLYAVEANTGAGIKFAPAPMVWNQYMYSPLKINEDLTVPSTVFDPLSSQLNFNKQFGTDPPFKKHIYNNTLTQVEQFSVFGELKAGGTQGNPADSIYIAYPITKLPDAVVSAKLTGTTLAIKIKNTGTATLGRYNAYAIYTGNASMVHTVTNANHVAHGVIGRDVFPGDSVEINQTVAAATDYIIRVSDANYATGAYIANQWRGSIYNECNWVSNVTLASDFLVMDNALTVVPYEQITINLANNNVYPSTCTTPVFEYKAPGASSYGGLPISGAWGKLEAGVTAGTIVYTAPATFPQGVVEFDYQVTCASTKSAKIYVYILENESDVFSVCKGTNMTLKVKTQPAGATFTWKNGAGQAISKNGPGTFQLNSDMSFYVLPHLLSPYDVVSFPEYKLTVYAIGSGSSVQELMRWKGSAGDGSWNNPRNWVKVGSGNIETTVRYAPNTCADVEIPSGVTTGYPKVDKASSVGKIVLKDRAMLANTHLLAYDSASVEVKFTAAERDRWVMYSAPLRKTYTGDFMLRNPSEVPLNGSASSDPAVYMSFFQTAYPDNTSIAATAKAFTQPFGKLDVPLPLGKSFNVWIDKDVDTATPFRFPSPLSKYDYWVHYPGGAQGTPQSTGVLDRTNGSGKRINGRFIVEDAASTNPTTGQFIIPASNLGDYSGYEYIMAPNPFMAYLDMNTFLTENSGILQNHYKVWDGNEAFISYQPTPVYRPGLPFWGGTWWITSNPSGLWDNVQYVSPLQSFIVEKKTTAPVAGLTYIPATMTSTTYSASAYQLKSAKENTIPEGILYITVSQNAAKNSTVLVNAPKASNDYVGGEDVGKLFYDNEGNPQMSIYTLTPEKEALDINLSGNFNGKEIPFGIRANVTGEIQLDFSGVATFGHKVYLLDGDKEIDLSANPTYKATIAGNGGDLSTFYEINNRFALKFVNNGNSIGSASSYVHIQAERGRILVNSDDPLESVEVLSIAGQRVFKSDNKVYFKAIDVLPEQVYIVRATTAKGVITRKVIVK